MRGELNAKVERGGPLRGDMTPSTPGTAASTRQNPPSYQRMHSNDSGKGSDKDINGNGSGLIGPNSSSSGRSGSD